MPISSIEALQRLIEAESLSHRPLIEQHIQRLLAWLRTVPAYLLKYDSLPPAEKRLRRLLP